MQLTDLLNALVKNGGSDLHIASGSVPMLRLKGQLMPAKVPPLSAEQVNEMINEIMTDFQKEKLKEDMMLDFAFQAENVGIFRVNVFYQRHGLSVVFRVLPEHPPTLSDLNLPPIFESASNYPNGLILVTGPTGSGKSTTLAAMINAINENKRGHILTLEDPVEFRHDSRNCMVNQRSLGQHFTTFAAALKAALREDPDVILVGELRDLETIKLALEAAETGHLVFGTLHTNSAAKTIDRIINVFPAEDQNQVRLSLSESLRMVVSQKLVINANQSKRLCFQDILVNNTAIANLVRENKTTQIISSMQTGGHLGMKLLDQELLSAVEKGDVKGDVAWEAANDKNMFKKYTPKDANVSAKGGSDTGSNATQKKAG